MMKLRREHQKAFETAYNGVMGQGRPSVGGGSLGACAYNDGDAHCGVGWLLHEAGVRVGGSDNIAGIASVLSHVPAVKKAVGHLGKDFLYYLQSAHDEANRSERLGAAPFTAAFDRNMRRLAERFGLDMSFADRRLDP